MFKLIRSARSRLSRNNSDAKEPSTLGSTSSSTNSDRHGPSSRIKSKFTGGKRHSENAAAEKRPLAAKEPTKVLGDATNTYTGGTQQKLSFADDLKCNKAKQQVATVTTHDAIHEDVAMDSHEVHSADPQHVEEYVQEIFQVLKREECVTLPSSSYMTEQKHLNAKMRAILVDWLVDVHRKYKMTPETLFLAVQLIDSYLEVQVIERRHLQLVGVASMLIASKFEEVYPPEVKEFVKICDKAFTRDEILNMEVCILKLLDFKICRPTPIQFLEKYQATNGCTEAHRHLAHYLLELTLMDYNMIKYTPSHLAAASIFLSNKLLRCPSWTAAMEEHTRITEPELKECAKEMCELLECADSSPLQAVRKKYSQEKFHSVAQIRATLTSARRNTGSLMDVHYQ